MATLNQGNSMAPLILASDRVIVSKARSFRVDDIVVFERGNRLIAHRIIYLDPSKKFLITRGDNNLKADRKIKPEKILGKVKSFKREAETIALSHIYLSQSVAYFTELSKIGVAFDKNRILYIILKGLPLHLYSGSTSPRRLYLDVDILIKKGDEIKVDRIFAQLGFEKGRHTLFGKKVKKPSQISYFKKIEPFAVVIDLHLAPAIGFTKIESLNRLLPPINPYTDSLFRNIQKIKLDGLRLPILKNETLVTYLFLHLYHHNFQGAHRLKFLDTIIRKQKIDWRNVTGLIKRYKFRNFVFPSSLILRHYYQTPIPHDFIKGITPSFGQKFVAQVIARFVSPFDSGTRAKEGAKRLLFLLFLSPRPLRLKLKLFLSRKVLSYFIPTIKSLLLRSLTNSS